MIQRFKEFAGLLQIQIRAPGNPPYGFQLSANDFYTLAIVIGLGTLGLATGTCLFFREVEINRKITERLLELETILFLQNATRSVPVAPVIETSPGSGSMSDEHASPAAPLSLREPTAIAVPTELTVTAKLNELAAECSETMCSVSTYLTPSSPGNAAGSLSLVLEAEVTRIGGADPNAPTRRQFVYYPGLILFDEFDSDKAATLEKKSFRFSRALPTRVQFTIGKLHRPIAINLYLFDTENNLVRHERKPLSHD